MLKEWQDMQMIGSGKYRTAFEAYVFANVNPQDCDEDASEGDGGGWVGRIGRRVMVEDAQGFPHVYRYPTESEARETFLTWRPIPLDTLTEDGDVIELSEGRTLRLRIEPDEGMTIDGIEGDCYGKLAYVEERSSEIGRQRSRPAGFDGNAEILRVGRGYDGYWWQPPADVKRGTDSFSKLRGALVELIEYGYYSVGLELLQGVDAYRRPIVANAARLGGIEPSSLRDESYLAETIGELASELGLV